jgi:osmotically-inducible protein OsmY
MLCDWDWGSPGFESPLAAIASEDIKPVPRRVVAVKGAPMRGDDLRANVTAELLWDPKIDGRNIVVSAERGAVTLAGSVASVRQKHEARNATRRVYGVTSVCNQLNVTILPESRRDDADVRADVLQALALDSTIPASVDACADDGLVTLTGTVAFHDQRTEAEFICANVRGVLEINDEIALESSPGSDCIQREVSAALRRSARLSIVDLSVDARSDGTVIVQGTVICCPEHDEAITIAWSAPGVTDVDDRIIVAY